MYQYQIDFDPAEFGRAIDALQKNKQKPSWYWPFVIGGGITIILVLILRPTASEHEAFVSSPSNLMPILLLLLLLILFRTWGSQFTSWVAQRSVPTLADGFTLSLAADNISRNINGETLTLNWEDLEKVEETDEFFLFYLGGVRSLYLPKRVLQNELGAVRKLLSTTLDGRFKG